MGMVAAFADSSYSFYFIEYKSFLNMLSKWTPISVGHVINKDVLGNNTSLEWLKTTKMSEVLK